MSKAAVGVGAALITLGVASYVGTGRQSKTALIPAGFGGALLGLGVADQWFPGRAALGGASSGVAWLGFAGSVRGMKHLPALLTDGDVERPAAVVAQSAMAVICAGYALSRLRR